jgi:hypothetical protein
MGVTGQVPDIASADSRLSGNASSATLPRISARAMIPSRQTSRGRRRSASRRPAPGREARKPPCQQLSHKYQASVPGDRNTNEIPGAGGAPSTRGGHSTLLT